MLVPNSSMLSVMRVEAAKKSSVLRWPTQSNPKKNMVAAPNRMCNVAALRRANSKMLPPMLPAFHHSACGATIKRLPSPHTRATR